MRAPLGRVLGYGSANEGARHWWIQRMTSLALIPLAIWFVVSLIALPASRYAVLADWMTRGWNALLLLLLGLVAARHSQLGVQVVIEDYVHAAGAKTLALILNLFAHILIAAAIAFAVLKTAL